MESGTNIGLLGTDENLGGDNSRDTKLMTVERGSVLFVSLQQHLFITSEGWLSWDFAISSLTFKSVSYKVEHGNLLAMLG